MKKIAIVFVFAVTLISCTQAKIGYVDVEEVLKEYKGTKDAEKEMKKRSTEIGGQLDQLAADYQAKVTDYYAKVQKMSAKTRQETEAVLMQQQEVLKQRQQQAQMDVQKDGQDRMAEIDEAIVEFVEDYAKEHNYSYIFGTTEQTKSVLYGKSENDLTDIILEALNDSYKKDKSTNTSENVEPKDSVK